MGIWTPGINKGAYQGELTCPFVLVINGEQKECGSRAIRYVEHITQYRIRYRCRKCGQTFQYDISNHLDFNPYGPYRKGRIWSKIEKALDAVTRMKRYDDFHNEQRRLARLRGGIYKGGVQ